MHAQAAFRDFCKRCGFRDGGEPGPRPPWIARLPPRLFGSPAGAPMASAMDAMTAISAAPAPRI